MKLKDVISLMTLINMMMIMIIIITLNYNTNSATF
jgi:hypothetical protein